MVGSAMNPIGEVALPQRTTSLQKNFVLFDRFQFALPPLRNAIILPRKAGISPVGAAP